MPFKFPVGIKNSIKLIKNLWNFNSIEYEKESKKKKNINECL